MGIESKKATFWDTPRKTSLRRWVFYVHFYAGLTAGLFFTIVGLTGSIITFARELRILEVPGGTHVRQMAQSVPLETLWATVRHARPYDTLVSLKFESDPTKALNFETRSPGGERIHTFINQYRGTILYQDNYDHRALQWIYDLHADLLGGRTGRTINAWLAILIGIVSTAGLLLWWRGRKYWRLGFQYNLQSSWKRQSWDLHSLGGFLFFLPLLVMVLTGVYYSYINRYIAIAAAVTRGPAMVPRPLASKYPAKWQPLDDILRNAERRMPDCKPTLVEFPTNEATDQRNASISIRVSCPIRPYNIMEPHSLGLSYAYVDPPTAQVLGVDRYDQAPLGVLLIRLITPTHFGEIGGMFTRVLWVILGLVPGTLFVTSLLMWWNRSLSKTWRRAAGAARHQRASRDDEQLAPS